MKQRLVLARNTPSTRGDGSGPPTEPRTESGGPKAVDRKRQQRQKLKPEIGAMREARPLARFYRGNFPTAGSERSWVKKQVPTYLPPPCLPPISAPLGCIHTCTPETSQVKYASHPTYPPYKRAAHPGLKKNAYLPTPPLPTPNVGALHPYPVHGACTRPAGTVAGPLREHSRRYFEKRVDDGGYCCRERPAQPPYQLSPARAGPAGCSTRTDASPVGKVKGWRSGVTSNVLLPAGLPAGFAVAPWSGPLWREVARVLA